MLAMQNERSRLHGTVHNPVSNEVRHLIILFRKDPAETQLVKLTGNQSEVIATGSEQATRSKADELLQQWQRHGFEYCRPKNPVPEPLAHFKVLARQLGYRSLYDPRHKSANSPSGEVALDEWQGVQGKNGGSYLYAMEGTTVHASPQLSAGHPLQLPRASGSDFADFFQRYKAALDEVGPHMEFTVANDDQ